MALLRKATASQNETTAPRPTSCRAVSDGSFSGRPLLLAQEVFGPLTRAKGDIQAEHDIVINNLTEPQVIEIVRDVLKEDARETIQKQDSTVEKNWRKNPLS